MNKQELFENIKRKESFLCVGLDTDIQKIPSHLLKEEDPVFAFNKAFVCKALNKTFTAVVKRAVLCKLADTDGVGAVCISGVFCFAGSFLGGCCLRRRGCCGICCCSSSRRGASAAC